MNYYYNKYFTLATIIPIIISKQDGTAYKCKNNQQIYTAIYPCKTTKDHNIP